MQISWAEWTATTTKVSYKQSLKKKKTEDRFINGKTAASSGMSFVQTCKKRITVMSTTHYEEPCTL